jgi:hypothetical protein
MVWQDGQELASIPLEERMRYTKPWIYYFNYRPSNMQDFSLSVVGIEDLSKEYITDFLKVETLKKFIHLKSSSGPKEVLRGVFDHTFRDMGGYFIGSIFIYDYEVHHPTGESLVILNEFGDEIDKFRGYGFSVNLNKVNSREAADLSDHILKSFGVYTNQDNLDFIRYMRESNVGYCSKSLDKKYREEIPRMQVIKSDIAEKLKNLKKSFRHLINK